jgi:polyisoprenoid-binding protein YceI
MMQEHFNENYLESEKFPNAAFKGKIDGFNSIKLSQDPQEVTLNGTLTIHGISQKIQEKGTIAILDGFIQGNAQFHIIVADYGIVVPKIVRNNIAKTMDITVSLKLKEK